MRRFLTLLVLSFMAASSQSYTYEKPAQPFPPVQMTFVQQRPSQMYLPVQQQYSAPTHSQPALSHLVPAPASQHKYLPPLPAPTFMTPTNQHSYLPPAAPITMYLPPSQPQQSYLPPPATKHSYLPPPASTGTYLPPKVHQNSHAPSQNFVSLQQPQQQYLAPQSAPNAYLPPQGSYQPAPSFATERKQLDSQTFLQPSTQNSYLPPAPTYLPPQPAQNNFLPAAPSNTHQSFSSVPAPAQPLHSQKSSQGYLPPKRPMIIMKNFYVHSAPEDHEEESFAPPPVRKHYRVLFIKSPVQKNAVEALRMVQPKDEEKTVIYVLSKKTDVNEIKSHIESEVKPISKPEVFFIKYKTHEEAEHAQHQIQAQYDALGGTSEVSNEGVAPVHSVVGSLDGAETVHGGAEEEPSSQYLPPSH